MSGYNPERVEGKRPRGGEVWISNEDPSVQVEIVARRSTSALMALRRRSKLSECEDLHSQVMFYDTFLARLGVLYESEFVTKYRYKGKK